HPLQRGDLIKQGSVSFCIGLTCETAEIEKAKQTQAIVAGHHDNIVLRGEGCPIVERFRTRASDKTAPMDIHHDGSFLPVSARRPDVQAQAVLAGGMPIDGGSTPSTCALERSWSKLSCIEHTGPGVQRPRWEKTTVCAGRAREWNAFPDRDGSLFKALYMSKGCLNEGCTHSASHHSVVVCRRAIL